MQMELKLLNQLTVKEIILDYPSERGVIAMTNLDSTLKSRDITLLTKVHLGKAMIFPVVMYGCEN